MRVVVVSLLTSQCRTTTNPLFLFEFLRISGEGWIISDLSLQHRHALRQPVIQVNPTRTLPNKNKIITKQKQDTIKNTITCNNSDLLKTISNKQFILNNEVIQATIDQNIHVNNIPKCLRCTNASMFY